MVVPKKNKLQQPLILVRAKTHEMAHNFVLSIFYAGFRRYILFSNYSSLSLLWREIMFVP